MKVLYIASSKVVRFAQRKEPDKIIQVVCQSVEKYGSDLYLFFTVNGIRRVNIYTDVIFCAVE